MQFVCPACGFWVHVNNARTKKTKSGHVDYYHVDCYYFD